MKLVINIPDDLYLGIKEDEYQIYRGRLYEMIKNGVPLPKGHGKIGDIDRLYKVFKKNVVGADSFKQLFDIAPAIIEAEGENDG